MGCFSHFKTFPATTPFRPPLTDSNGKSFSTSKPRLVNMSDISSGLEFVWRYSLSQLIDIFTGFI